MGEAQSDQKMLSMSVQANINASITKPSISVAFKPFRASSSLSLKPRTSISGSKLTLSRRLTRKLDLSASVSTFPDGDALAGDALAEDALAEDEDIVSESEEETVKEEEELLEVDVDTVTKPRLVLKFIWMEKNIGIGLDQQLPDYGTVPLSPYYFWPRKDAWDELKVLLENKPWVSQKQMVLLLNQATDIINLWQQGGGKLTSAQSS